MRVIHALALGGALALVAGAAQASTLTVFGNNTRPTSDFSSTLLPGPNGTLEAFNPDGYYAAGPEAGVVVVYPGARSHVMRSGRASAVGAPVE